ncbi:IS110 family transposase [Flavisolibacter tropicus]|uniref:IS110 family transposase n=1 Tax=Flavisolibacter tropicus TaxID=1492898 RepID=UPI00082C798B|nr:IS110 family transposase [Flavisolibacter tropicus]
MDLLKYGIGIDMAMDSFDVCLSVIDRQQHVIIQARSSFSNDKTGFDRFDAWCTKHKKLPLPTVYLMEATGVYYEQLAWYLHTKAYDLSVVLPNKARKYKESLGLKSKTDRIDAKGLAQMACEQQCSRWQPLSANIYRLRLVTRQIQNLTEQAIALSNQLHALQHGMFRDKDLEKMLQKQLVVLKKNKASLKTKVQALIDADPALKQKFEKIGSIKGLGCQSLAVIVAETNGFAAFESAGQLVSYAGYDVVANDSGKRVGKTKISKKGNSRIRRCLHFPAFNMIKYEVGVFKNLYQRVYERSKLKMKAYTAVQKKLLMIIYALWKNNEAFIDKIPGPALGDTAAAPSVALVGQGTKN